MPSKSSLLILCAVIFTDMLAFSLVIPSLPFVVTQYGGTGLTLGLLFTAIDAVGVAAGVGDHMAGACVGAFEVGGCVHGVLSG